jgi:hypothetical protein
LEVVYLTHPIPPGRHTPPRPLDLEAITAHLHALADTQSCPDCDTAVTPVIEDVAHLLSILAQLYDELASARLEAANLRAAIRAALGAATDAEPDPLAYLRWELPEPHQHTPAPGSGRGWCA